MSVAPIDSMVVLKDALHYPHPRVRLAALHAIRQNPEALKAAVPLAAEALGDSDASVRALADQVLVFSGAQSAPLLGNLLRDAVPEARTQIYSLLYRLRQGAAGAAPALVERLKFDDRQEALNVLAGIGPVPVDALLELLNSPDWIVKKSALTILRLGHEKSSGAVQQIAGLLNDANTEVRISAACALSGAGPAVEAVADKIIAVMESDDNVLAMFLLGATQHLKAHADRLLPALKAKANFNNRRENNTYYLNFMHAIWRFDQNTAAVLPLYIRAVKSRDPNNFDNMLGAKLIAEVSPDAVDAIPELANLVCTQQSNPIFGDAVEALRKMKTAARAPLIAALNDPQPENRAGAARAIIAIGYDDVPHVEVYAAFLESRYDEDARRDAFAKLCEAGAKAAHLVPQLLSILKKKEMQSGNFQEQAIELLGCIGLPAKDALPTLRDIAADLKNPLCVAAAANIPIIEGQVSPALWDALNGADYKEAARAIAKFKEPVLPKIIALLKNNPDSIHSGATAVLKDMGPVAIPALVTLAGDADQKQSSLGCVALPWMGEAAIPALSELATSPNPGLRYRAISNLQSLRERSKPAASVFIAALADIDRMVQFQAMISMRYLGDAGAPAIPALIKALQSRDPQTRMYAAAALGNVGKGNDPAIAAIIEATSDISKDARTAAIGALAGMGPRGVPALLTLLVESDPQTCEMVNKGLFANTAVAIPLLMNELTKQPPNAAAEQVRFRTLDALAACGPLACPQMFKLSRDAGLRAAVLERLQKLGDVAVPGLVNMLK